MITVAKEGKKQEGYQRELVLKVLFLYRFDFQIHANVLHIQKDEIKWTLIEGILKVNINENKLI